MITIEFQHADNGTPITTVEHPAVPRIGEVVILKQFQGTVASVAWQWLSDSSPRCYVALRR